MIVKNFKKNIIKKVISMYDGNEDAVQERFDELDEVFFDKGYVLTPLALYGYLYLEVKNIHKSVCCTFMELCNLEGENSVMHLLDLFDEKFIEEE